MKILIASNIIDTFIMSYFMPYKINKGKGLIYNNELCVGETVPAWLGDKEIEVEIIEKKFEFRYKDYDIDYVIVEIFNKEELSNITKTHKEYDKYYFIKSKFFNNGFENEWNIKIDNLEIIFLNTTDNFHASDDDMNSFLDKYKIISNSPFYIKRENLYHDPFLLSMLCYYDFGYHFLSYSDIKSIKTNLIGTYLRLKYKPPRDLLFNEIKDIFINKELDDKLLKIYKPDQITLLVKLWQTYLYKDWQKSQISSYTDYITSVCGFVFETINYNTFDCPANSKGRNYMTEKVQKAILFSKLNIPFIVDMSAYNFIELNNAGYWLLNTEFFDFDKVKSEDELADNMKNSIIKSVEYVIDLYKENNYDLTKTHEKLVELYSDKMQNNYNLFVKYLNAPKDHDKLIEFILK